MTFELNQRASQLVSSLSQWGDLLGIHQQTLANGGTIADFGVKSPGGLQAGIELARVCLSDLATVTLSPAPSSELPWPLVCVQTDHPVPACLFSQYAGWEIQGEKYFAMGSGPMRAIRAQEELFHELGYQEYCHQAVGVLETSKLPPVEVIDNLADQLELPASAVTLLCARTASLAGTMQIVARSVETALHKLHELKFDLTRIRHGLGTAPLPPVGKNDLVSIGRTNDAILYGGQVHLWVTGDDDSLSEIGPQVPSNCSPSFGEPFLKLFQDAGHDFYKLDKMLFSPAEIIFQNLTTGRTHRFGTKLPELLQKSFA